MLTLRQVEKGIKGIRHFKTFEYSKFTEGAMHLFAHLMNIGELYKNRDKAKEQSKQMMYIAVFPVQKYIAISITGIEFTKRKEKFITDEQLNEINNELQPGDILLKRNDWQATNLGISGFWTHSGLYIGNIQEMDEYFSDVKSLKGEKFSDVLKNINQNLYDKLLNDSELTVIEAIEEGVSLKPLSNIAKVDYFSSLRPKISKEEKVKVIKRAFSYVGRPYDYHFDIDSDNEFFCTKVIKKAFDEIMSFPISKKLGKEIVLPNDIVKKYSKERLKKNRDLDFVLFYDLDIHSKKAYQSTEEEFSETYKRNIFFYRKRDIIRYLATIVEH